jgi:TonB family protein
VSVTFAYTQEPKVMKARTFIGGATIVLIAGAILGYSATVPDGCADRAAVAISDFDPFKLPEGVKAQEPWLDPFVFLSDKAYVVHASTSTNPAPASEAAYVGGHEELVSYLKANTVPHVAKGIGWLKPPMITFTVNAQGGTEDVVLVRSCGNEPLDARLIELIANMPKWKPAKDANGRAIAQAIEFHVVQAACDQQPPPAIRSVSMYDVPLTDSAAAMDHPYDLHFRLEKAGESRYTLISTMDLHGGSFYVSPNSTRDFKGKFHVEVADLGHVVLEDSFKEIPRSIEVIDLHRFVNGPVDWVNADTKYEHTLTVTTKEDFDIGGKYQFTIEPKCTMEIIPFLIKQRSGVLTIEKWKC